MTGACPPRVIATLTCAAAVWVHAQTAPPAPPQTFRAATDLVAVDVSVRRGNTPVPGLTAGDFDLRDNGVVQRLESVEVTDVPIDLSIVIDVSGNPSRPDGVPPPRATLAAKIDQEARKLTRWLRPDDRVRLIVFDTYFQQLWPLQPLASVPPVRALEFEGHAAFYNTLATLLLQPVEPTRRHVIVADTLGRDSISLLASADVRAIAAQSDAQLHVVTREVDADAEASIRPHQCFWMDKCWPTDRFWTPPTRRRLFNAVPVTVSMFPRVLFPDGVDIKASARSTGGDLYQGVGFSEPTLANTFERAFQHFRQSYVLRYRPAGVRREGWHRLAVTVPADPTLKILARSGYAIDAPPPPAPPPAAIAETTRLRSLDELIDGYTRGAFIAVTRSLRQTTNPSSLITEFLDRGNPWPGSPRREALFALELAEAGLFAANPETRKRARDLLDRFGRLVRHPLGPDAFERAWLLAEVTMLQSTIRPAETRPYIERAIARFPGEPRFLLARAILTDQEWPAAAGAIETRGLAPSPGHVAAVTSQYRAVLDFPDTRADAAIRLGWFQHRLGQSEEALTTLALADGVERQDPYAGYLRDLLRGHVLLARDRATDAVAAYRGALTIRPAGHAARVALMSALLVDGQRTEAEAIADAIQAGSGTSFDPWWLYWQGDYRRFPDAMDAARAMIR